MVREDFDTTKHAIESWEARLRRIVNTAKIGMDIAVYAAGCSPKGRKHLKDHHFCEDSIPLFCEAEKILDEMYEEIREIDKCRAEGKQRKGARDGK